MWRDKKGAVFDMDGTLVDSMWIWDDLDLLYAERQGYDKPEDLKQKIEGLSMYETAVYFRDAFHLPDSVEKIQADWVEMAREAYRTKVTLKKGALELLREMKMRGMKTGIATSNSIELVRECLGHLGVLELFDTIRTSEEIPRGKPEPDIYLSVAKEWGTDPRELIVFEDVPNGAIAGKRAGMQVVGVADRCALDQRERLEEICDLYIEDFTKLL